MQYRYYPISLDLKNRKCLVVGGGIVAERKIISLLDCGAKIVVVSPEVTINIANLAFQGLLTIEKRKYSSKDIDRCFLVIGATNNQEVNQEIARDCNNKNVLINIVDDPINCNFILPAVVRRGSLSISVSTEGKSPLLARKIKEELEKRFGLEYEEYINLLGEARDIIKENFKDPKERYDKFNNLLDLDILELLRKGKNQIAKERINHVLNNSWSES